MCNQAIISDQYASSYATSYNISVSEWMILSLALKKKIAHGSIYCNSHQTVCSPGVKFIKFIDDPDPIHG